MKIEGTKWTSLASAAAMVLALAAPALADSENEKLELQTQVDQAQTILNGFRKIPEKAIPDAVLRSAKGLAFLTVLRAGFIISGSGGKGVVVAKLDDGTWSGPSFIGTGGAGFGFQIGAQISEFVMVLNTPGAVAAFAKGGNVAIGAQISAAAGPVGRSLGADVMPQAAIYTYSRAQGLFGGVSLDGTVVATRKKANETLLRQRGRGAGDPRGQGSGARRSRQASRRPGRGHGQGREEVGRARGPTCRWGARGALAGPSEAGRQVAPLFDRLVVPVDQRVPNRRGLVHLFGEDFDRRIDFLRVVEFPRRQLAAVLQEESIDRVRQTSALGGERFQLSGKALELGLLGTEPCVVRGDLREE